MGSTNALRMVTFYHDPDRETDGGRSNSEGYSERFRPDVFPLFGFDEEAGLAERGRERLVEIVSEFEDSPSLFCSNGDASCSPPKAEPRPGAE